MATVSLLGLPATSAAAPRQLESLVADGSVESIVRVGDRLYLAGAFSRLGPNTGPGLALDPVTGRRDAGAPRIEGEVLTAISDGAGGFFVGGDLERVGAVPRRSLAHLLPDGSLDLGFDPSPNGVVRALALSGGRLYVGGAFGVIGGRSRNRLAALDPATGSVDPDFDPDIGFGGVPVAPITETPLPAPAVPAPGLVVPGPPASSCNQGLDDRPDHEDDSPEGVLALLAAGDRLYVGGSFSGVAGVRRNNLAVLNAVTGELDRDFDPDSNSPGFDPRARERRADTDGAVAALALSGSRLYLAGRFTTVAGRSRARLAAVDAVTGGVLRQFDPAPEGEVSALAASDARIYAGGSFSRIGQAQGAGLAALDSTTGAADQDFRAAADGPVRALALAGDRLYVGGGFRALNGAPRNRIAAVAAASGALDPGFDPNADRRVATLALSGGRLFTGGDFDSIDGVFRRGLAAVELHSGLLAAEFRPPEAMRVFALTASARRLYASARFGGGGEERVVAIDPRSGQLDRSFRAGLSRGLRPIVALGSRLYGRAVAPGSRSKRQRIVALDARTGARDRRFHASLRGNVAAIVGSRARLYVGGEILRRARPARRRARSRKPKQENLGLIALGLRSGARLPGFRPRLDIAPGLRVSAILKAGSRLYLSGGFRHVGGRTREGLAALDPLTGRVQSRFRPPPQLRATSLALGGGRLYLNTRPSSRSGLTVLDARTGALDAAQQPALEQQVCTLYALGSRLFAGGSFVRVGTARQPRLAAFDFSM